MSSDGSYLSHSVLHMLRVQYVMLILNLHSPRLCQIYALTLNTDSKSALFILS